MENVLWYGIVVAIITVVILGLCIYFLSKREKPQKEKMKKRIEELKEKGYDVKFPNCTYRDGSFDLFNKITGKLEHFEKDFTKKTLSLRYIVTITSLDELYSKDF